MAVIWKYSKSFKLYFCNPYSWLCGVRGSQVNHHLADHFVDHVVKQRRTIETRGHHSLLLAMLTEKLNSHNTLDIKNPKLVFKPKYPTRWALWVHTWATPHYNPVNYNSMIKKVEKHTRRRHYESHIFEIIPSFLNRTITLCIQI